MIEGRASAADSVSGHEVRGIFKDYERPDYVIPAALSLTKVKQKNRMYHLATALLFLARFTSPRFP